MNDKKSETDSNIKIIWNEIYENTYRKKQATPFVVVAEKKENGVMTHHVSKPFHKLLCLFEIPILGLPYAKTSLFEGDSKYWTPKDGPTKFTNFIYHGFFNDTDVKKSRRLDNKYKMLIRCLVDDVEKHIKSESVFFRKQITATYAVWKWAEKQRNIPKDFQIIADEELEYENLDDLIGQLICSIREKNGIYRELPEKWHNPYVLLAGMALFALVSIPLFYKNEKNESIPVYEDDEVAEKQKKIREQIVAYFQKCEDEKTTGEESYSDFGIRIVEKWSDAVLKIIKISQEIHVSIPDATGKQEITLHVNMERYGEFYNQKYASALMNGLNDEIEEILEFLQGQMDGLERLAQRLNVLRESMERTKNPLIQRAFAKEINEVGKSYTIGDSK